MAASLWVSFSTALQQYSLLFYWYPAQKEFTLLEDRFNEQQDISSTKETQDVEVITIQALNFSWLENNHKKQIMSRDTRRKAYWL